MNIQVNSQNLILGDADLTCDLLVAALRNNQKIAVSEAGIKRVRSSRVVVQNIIDTNTPAYGITTGVGSQKDHAVDAAAMQDYNRKLIKGHATRVPGPTWSSEVVRGALIILLNEFIQGYSGVSEQLINLLVEKTNNAEMPIVDASGSVGASDLVPLAQLANWLFSFPEAVEQNIPKPKETLSMINCNAFTLSVGAIQIIDLNNLLDGFNIASAVTMEGFRCNLGAISEPVNAVHKRHGQRMVAQDIRSFLKGSALWQVGAAKYLQDPLSFRTVTQAHGATFEIAERLTEVWNDELSSVNDNPITDLDTNAIYSHGNMDTTRFTLALDTMRQALAKNSDLSGERIHKLQWPAFSGLPIGLAESNSAIGGVQFLNLGHIAASLITSVKIWANPHLLYSVGQLADGVEDTAGHAMHSVHDLQRQLDACWKIIAIEIAVAAWAIHIRKLPRHTLGQKVRDVYEAIIPLLPIGKEGHEIFDISILVDEVRSLKV